MIVTQRQGISSVNTFLAQLSQQLENIVQQRLREWTYDAPDKRGSKRLAFAVTKTFPELSTWVIQHIPVCQEQLVLVADATWLSNRMVVLAISVVIDGSAIPVAWHIQPLAKRGSWNAIWTDLIALLAPVTVDTVQVLLLTDRGARLASDDPVPREGSQPSTQKGCSRVAVMVTTTVRSCVLLRASPSALSRVTESVTSSACSCEVVQVMGYQPAALVSGSTTLQKASQVWAVVACPQVHCAINSTHEFARISKMGVDRASGCANGSSIRDAPSDTQIPHRIQKVFFYLGVML